MKKGNKIPQNVDEYIDTFVEPVRSLLVKMRALIKKAAPRAEEVISYQMPTYKQNRALVHFAGYKNHIGFYPAPSGIAAFKKELSGYAGAKGSVQFPIDNPLPSKLISDIVKFRAAEDAEEFGKPEKKKKAESKSATSKKKEVTVESWLNAQDKKVREDIALVRKMIRKAAPALNERVKWNAPSYYLDKDLFTFGPYRKRMVLVFHHPAIVKIKSPLLEGNHKDRRLLYMDDAADAKKKQKELERIIKALVKTVS